MKDREGRLYRQRTLKSGKVFEVLICGKWKSTGQFTFERAVTWARKNEAEDSRDILFRDFARGFFLKDSRVMKKRNMRGRIHSEGWYVQTQARLEMYVAPYFGSFYLNEITPRVVDEWLLNLKSPKNKEISAATKNKVMSCLRAVLQEAVVQEKIEKNPVDSLQPFIEKNKERRIFSEEEIDLLFPADEETMIKMWGGLMWACYFSVLKDTGHRMGEQAALTWDDLFSENGQYGFTITKSMDWFSKKIKPATKTGYSRATLISPRTYRLLMIYKERCPWDLIFSLDGNRGIIAETARKHLKYAAKNVGVELNGRTPYCFRHTANTNLLLCANPQQVRFLMGHRTEKETDNYNHPDRRLLIQKAIKIKGEA